MTMPSTDRYFHRPAWNALFILFFFPPTHGPLMSIAARRTLPDELKREEYNTYNLGGTPGRDEAEGVVDNCGGGCGAHPSHQGGSVRGGGT